MAPRDQLTSKTGIMADQLTTTSGQFAEERRRTAAGIAPAEFDL